MASCSKVVAVLLITALLITSDIGVCRAYNTYVARCFQNCMPVCMGVQGATEEMCRSSCDDGCRLMGVPHEEQHLNSTA
uniref:Thionin-like protein 2 n=1 Tax=Nelumbo nucifera TaxID=4432 RepID=A0A822YB35_NELNU|nr:TPA_asm: hypothetical protein HUJ06_028226 [Nelumbo nucifera]